MVYDFDRMIPCTRLTISPVAASSCMDFFCFYSFLIGSETFRPLPITAAHLCFFFKPFSYCTRNEGMYV